MSDLEHAEKTPSLYDWAGGEPALEKLTAVFYDKVSCDALLSPVFAQMGPDYPQHVASFICEVLGGTDDFSRHRVGHTGMVTKHLGKYLTEVQRRRWMELLLLSADEVGLPSDPEFRSAFVGYIEWGSRLAVINSQPGVIKPPESSPMPKWGWGEVGGPFKG